MSEPFSSAAHDFAPGAQIAGYKIVEEIGRGGMAVVYQARDTRLERWVALKILAPQFASDDGFRQRFIRESRAAAAVDHPNIIPIFDAGEADGVLYIAMRFVSGQDVHSLLRRTGPLPVTRVAGIISQIAAALDAAHARGLVHRDVKPANMLLTDPSASTADHVYLSDFGISKQIDAAVSLTSTGQLVGTLNYLAPEQIEGHTVDGRADQYALACSAYEMLAGEPPFKRDQSLAVIWAQLSASAPALTSRRPDLPAALDQIMARALAKSPADRYGTCGAMAASFAAACGLGPGDLAAGAAGGRSSPGQAGASAFPVTGAAAGGRSLDPAAAGSAPPGSGYPGSGYPGSGYPGSGYPGPGYPGSGYPGQAYPGSGYPGSVPPEAATPGAALAGTAYRGPASPGAALAGAAPPAAPPGARPGGFSRPAPGNYQPPKQRRGRGWVILLLCVAVLAAACAAYAVHRHRLGATPPIAPSTSASTAPPAADSGAGPVKTLREYVAAINARNYARAWALGGSNTGSSYASFLRGFSTTRRDTLTVQGASGDQVTAEITAIQTDGSVQVYQGTYTVENGVITKFNTHRVS